MRPDAGEADVCLLLICLLGLQLLAGQSMKVMSQALTEAYAALDGLGQRPSLEDAGDLEVLGQKWARPAPRVDYGADYQREQDAEAICFIVQSFLSGADTELYRCD